MLYNANAEKEQRDAIRLHCDAMLLCDLIIYEANLKMALGQPGLGQRRKQYIELCLDISGDAIAHKLYQLYV